MSKEALKLALEALENGKRVRNAEGGTKYQPDLEDKAIAAIKQALEQPVQEPVCHICKGTGEMDHGGTYPWGEAINIPCECTTPPAAQRPWVGLDDTDIGNEYVRFEIQGGFNRFEYAVRAIEAKLKEKNT